MLVRNWVLLGHAIIYHKNLTLCLHCIHFAATSKFCTICHCVIETLVSFSGPSLTQYNLIFLIVFGTEKILTGYDITKRISPQTSGYGCDISVYRILWYRRIWDMISRSIAIYQWISHRISPKHQAKQLQREPTVLLRSTACFLLAVYFPFSPCLPSGHFCRPSVICKLDTSQNWPHQQQTANLSPHDSACRLSAR